jgi:hypothetical protein
VNFFFRSGLSRITISDRRGLPSSLGTRSGQRWSLRARDEGSFGQAAVSNRQGIAAGAVSRPAPHPCVAANRGESGHPDHQPSPRAQQVKRDTGCLCPPFARCGSSSGRRYRGAAEMKISGTFATLIQRFRLQLGCNSRFVAAECVGKSGRSGEI